MCDELGVPSEIAALTRADLETADEIFTATTAGGLMPASRLDGRIHGNDRPGPLSQQLKDTYWRWHEEGRGATPVDYG